MRKNRLLAALQRRDFETLRPQLQWVELDHGQVLVEPNDRVRYIYFPVASVISQLSVMEDGSSVEAASIGREGLVGLPALLGADRTPTRSVVQLPGPAVRIAASALDQRTLKLRWQLLQRRRTNPAASAGSARPCSDAGMGAHKIIIAVIQRRPWRPIPSSS